MIDYTNHDYDALKARITDLYKDKEGIGEGYEGSTGQVLIQLLTDAADGLHYLLERRTQESFVTTAKLESSIWAAVSDIGYRPRRTVSSTGVLNLELLDADGNPMTAAGNIYIPYGKRVTFNGQDFIVNEDYTIPAGESSIEIQVKQGVLREQILNFQEEPYVSDNYFTIDEYKNIEEFSLKIIGDETYEDVLEFSDGLRIRSISFADSTMPVYDIKYYRSGMRVVFGDGTFGKKPTSNMFISYVESLGSDVNVVSTGLEFEFDEDKLTDDQLITPANEYSYTLKNTTPIRGGRMEESIVEMKENVTAFVRSNDRSVTNFDYSFWVRRSGIGDLADVKIYGEHETNRLIFTMNNVYVSYATNDGLQLNPIQVEQIRSYMDRLKHITTHLVFRPVDRISLALDVEFKRHPSLPISNSQLYRIVVDRINEYFKVGRGSIGKQFQHSEFVEYLQNLVVEFNSITYPMTDFVKVKVDGMVPFNIPQPSYDGIIEVSDDFNITSNQVWTVVVDDKPFTVVTSSTDSVATMVDKMQAAIFSGTQLMVARPADNQIRLRHPLDSGVFTVSVGSGDLTEYTTFKQFISIPRPTNTYNANVDQIQPDSVSIVDVNGNVLMSDNGDGFLVSNDYSTVEINYADCRFQTPSIPSNTYYINFQQNQYQNFDITDEGLIDVMPFREQSDASGTYFFSKLTLI